MKSIIRFLREINKYVSEVLKIIVPQFAILVSMTQS